MHEKRAGPVGDAFRLHSMEKTEIIDVFADVWKKLRNRVSCFAVALVPPWRTVERHFFMKPRARIEKLHFLAAAFLQFRLQIERIDLAGPALHEKKNNPFGSRNQWRVFCREGIFQSGCTRHARAPMNQTRRQTASVKFDGMAGIEGSFLSLKE